MLRNRLNSGDYVVPVPVGLPVTIIYNSLGLLEDVVVQLVSDGILSEMSKPSKLLNSNTVYSKNFNQTDRFLECIKHTIPTRIPLQGGTTAVVGVCIITNIDEFTGHLPEAFIDNVDAVQIDAFYAFHMQSFAMSLGNVHAVRTWLRICKFPILEGFLAPTENMNLFLVRQNSCLDMVHAKYAMYFAAFNLGDTRILSNDLAVEVISSDISESLNDNGVFMSQFCTNKATQFNIPTSQACRFNLNTGSMIWIQNHAIIDSELPIVLESNLKNYSERVCPVCGRIIKFFNSKHKSVFRCDDEDCMSRQYAAYCHMCNVLRAPAYGFEEYLRIVSDQVKIHPGMTVADFVNMYAPNIVFHISFTTLFEAAIPDSLVPVRKEIWAFISQCRNRWDTIQHYLNHVDRISVDLDFGNIDSGGYYLIEALKLYRIKSIIYTLYDSRRIVIEDTDKIMDVDPIFRGTIICITGDFKCGNRTDVIGILRSYGAVVVEELLDKVRYVIIGSEASNIDGVLLQAARDANIPTIEEDQFFEVFGIQQDLDDNLL